MKSGERGVWECKRGGRRLLVGAWALLTACGSCWGQGEPGGAPAPAAVSVASPDRAVLDRLRTDLVSFGVLQLLRSIESPTVDDYRAAALGLRIARRTAPNDAELLRVESEAWGSAQEADRSLECTRALLRLDPADTVSLLRVASSSMGKLQDADQRLRAYDGLINAPSIDKSVRSRLALDAALLARENGDDRGFLDRLTLSTTLDSTNKEAAALYVTFFLDRTSDPRERFDLLTLLLLADPLDAEMHRNVAFELRRQGAYQGSARFLDLARTINNSEGKQLTAAQNMEFMQSVWDTKGADKCLEELQKLLDLDIIKENLRRDTLTKAGRSPGPEQDIRLPPALERLRLMIHVARMDDSGAAISVDSLRRANEEAQIRLRERSDADEDPNTPANLRPGAVRRSLTLDYVWVRLFSGMNLETVENDLDLLSKPGDDGTAPISDEAIARFKGWLAAIRGEAETAKKLLEPLAEADPSARWALGLLAQRQGDTEGALRMYELLAREHAATALGSTARLRWERLKGAPMPLPAKLKEIESAAMGFVPALGDIARSPRAFLTLTVEAVESRIGPLDRPSARFVLRNVGRLAMGVGEGRPINPRMLLAAQMVIGGRDVSTQIRPEVVSAARRLRLMPGESIDITVPMGRGDMLARVSERVTGAADYRWSVTQGFVLTGEGGFTAGAGSLRAQSELGKRLPLDPGVDNAALAERVLKAAEPASHAALALAAYRVSPSRRGSDIDPVTEADASTLTAAITEKLGACSATEAMLLSLVLTANGAAEPFTDAIGGAVERLNDPGLSTLVLALVAKDEQSVLMEKVGGAAASDAEFARYHELAKAGFNRSRSKAPVKLDAKNIKKLEDTGAEQTDEQGRPKPPEGGAKPGGTP